MTSHSAATGVADAVEVLRSGGLVAFPTDTLYGLGADALNPDAIERVFQAKGRPQGMPLPLLIADASQLALVVDGVPEAALRLAEAFWPGGLTLVLPVAQAVPPLVTARGWKVAVRQPDHPVPLALARGLGRPITGTSANRSGGPDPRTAEGVREALADAVDMVIEGGPAPAGRSSTVLDVTAEQPRILRLGAVSQEAIEGVLGAAVDWERPSEARA